VALPTPIDWRAHRTLTTSTPVLTTSTLAPTVAEKAYRTELSPVSFLRRSAYVYPDKVAVAMPRR